MPNFIEGIDDPLVTDGNMSFGGGVDMQVDPGILEQTASAELKNMAMNRFGVLQTRRGTDQLGDADPFAATIQGLAELDTPTIEQLIAVSAGVFKKLVGTTWTTINGYTATVAAAMVNMVQGVNVLYIADGTANMRSYDGTSFTDLGSDEATYNPPIGNLLVWHTSRMFLSGVSAYNDFIYVSDILDAGSGHWKRGENSLRIGGGEGDAITALASWIGNKLVAFKNNSFYVIEADPQVEVANFTIERISPFIGCVAHRSVAQVGNDLFFLSRDGVRSVVRTVQAAQNEVSVPLSWPMQPIIDRINWTHASKSNGIFYDNKYILAVPIDTATTPNYVIVYDTRAQRWSGYWTGWTPKQFLMSKLANARHLYFAQSTGSVWEWLADSDEDDGDNFLDVGSTAYASLWKGRALVFGDQLSLKGGWCINMEFYRSQATAKLDAIIDQGDAQTIDASFETENVQNALPVDLPFDLAIVGNRRVAEDTAALGEFREIQFQISSTTGKLSIKSVLAQSFLNNTVYEEGT